MRRSPPSPSAVSLVRTVDTTRLLQAAAALIGAKLSPYTRKAYARELEAWVRFCAGAGADPANPTLNHATAYRTLLLAQGAPTSARRALAALSSIYGDLVDHGVARVNPFYGRTLDWPKAPESGTTVAVTPEQAEQMLELAAAEPRDFAILRLLHDLGLRRGSIITLERAALVRRGRELWARVTLKGHGPTEVRLRPETEAAVAAWLRVAPASTFVFPGTQDGHLHESNVNAIVARYAKAIGEPKLHPHSFRAAFVTAAYDSGLPEAEIQASVHHRDARTTKRYDRGRRGVGVADAVAEWRKTQRGGK